MDLRARLQQLADALPPSGAVTFSRGDLLELLDQDGAGSESPQAVRGDLTLEQVAERVHRAVPTIRQWCSSGLIPGAYRLRGKSWRVPTTALEAYLRQQPGGAAKRVRRARTPADLGTWRKVVGQT